MVLMPFWRKLLSFLIAESSDEAQVVGFNCDLTASSLKLANITVVLQVQGTSALDAKVA